MTPRTVLWLNELQIFLRYQPDVAAALRRLLSNTAEIEKRSDAAWEHAKSLPRWQDTAAKIATALEKAMA